MTKVQVHYELVRPLSDEDAESVARAHSVYGIMRVYVAPALDRIAVDFDASRLSEREVEAALIRTGVPLRRESVATPSV
jgi:copper chaperone CopZ